MSSLPAPAAARLLQCLHSVPDPRSKHGVSHPFHTVITIVIPGLPAGISTIAEIKRWSALHKKEPETFLRLRDTGVLEEAFRRVASILSGVADINQRCGL
jgi:hypothetical protein